MSAFLRLSDKPDWATTPNIYYLVESVEDAYRCSKAIRIGDLFFYVVTKRQMDLRYARMREPIRRDLCNAFAFDGWIPESMSQSLIGMSPKAMIADFIDLDKPEGCGWMNRSRIVFITNHRGSVLVELERVS